MCTRTVLLLVVGLILSLSASAGTLKMDDATWIEEDEARIQKNVLRGPASLGTVDPASWARGYCEDIAGRLFHPGSAGYHSCVRDTNPYRDVRSVHPPIWLRPRHYEMDPAWR